MADRRPSQPLQPKSPSGSPDELDLSVKAASTNTKPPTAPEPAFPDAEREVGLGLLGAEGGTSQRDVRDDNVDLPGRVRDESDEEARLVATMTGQHMHDSLHRSNLLDSPQAEPALNGEEGGANGRPPLGLKSQISVTFAEGARELDATSNSSSYATSNGKTRVKRPLHLKRKSSKKDEQEEVEGESPFTTPRHAESEPGDDEEGKDKRSTDDESDTPKRNQRQLDVVNPPFDLVSKQNYTKTKIRRNEFCGSYFWEVCEDVFSAQLTGIRLSTHPDMALRIAGLIHQTGAVRLITRNGMSVWYGKHEVHFDVRSQRWRHNSTQQSVWEAEDSISDREDFVPNGVIFVVGALDVKQMEEKDEQRRVERQKADAEYHRFRGVRRRATNMELSPISAQRKSTSTGDMFRRLSIGSSTPTAEGASSGPNESCYTGYHQGDDCDDHFQESLIDIGDPSAEFLSVTEQMRYIRHYLTRGVIGAAHHGHASIVHTGVDDIARLLGIGWHNLFDTLGTQPVRNHRAPPRLIGINPRKWENDIDLHFSHHLLLERDGGHEVIDSKPGVCQWCKEKMNEDSRWKPCSSDEARQRRWEKLKPDDDVSDPPQWAVSRFTQAMLEALHGGFQRKLNDSQSKAPPNRDAVPVVVVLVGGGFEAVDDAYFAAAKGWPIILVEGSGGITSHLEKILRRLDRLSAEDRELEVAKLDSKFATIVSCGKLKRIPKGTDELRFRRIVQDALKGDEILFKAWRLYSLWRSNEFKWAYYHRITEVIILTLGVIATAVSVMLTFIRLWWEATGSAGIVDRWTETGAIYAGEVYYYLGYVVLQWLVIFAPIALTLVLAIHQRLNPWGKLSALRIGANSILKEIYMYRTQTLGYSPEAIRRQIEREAQRVAGAADPLLGMKSGLEEKDAQRQREDERYDMQSAGLEPYNSREELLGQMVVRLQRELLASDVRGLSLGVLKDDSVPPQHIIDLGDNGIADLTPDDYVRFRLRSSKIEFTAKAEADAKILKNTTGWTLIWTAAGTTFAALAAFGLTYLQALVALCTALVDAHYRYLDYSRLQSIVELNNATVNQLSEVEGWWAALGTNADSARNKSRLVEDTEEVLQKELEGWARRMQRTHDELHRAQKEARLRRDETKQEERQQHQEEARALSELGVEAMQPQSIVDALKDGSGPKFNKLKKQFLTLNDKLGAPIKPKAVEIPEVHFDEELPSPSVAMSRIREVGESAINKVADAPMHLVEVATNEIQENDEQAFAMFTGEAASIGRLMELVVDGVEIGAVLQDPKLSEYFTNNWTKLGFNVHQITPFLCQQVIAEYSSRAAAAITAALKPIELLMAAKQNFLNKLVESIVTEVGFTIPPDWNEIFISQMLWAIDDLEDEETGKSAGVLPARTFCQFIRHPALKDALLGLPQEVLDRIQVVCVHKLKRNPDDVFHLFMAAVTAVASLDTNEAQEDDEMQMGFVQGIATLKKVSPLGVDVMSKTEILGCFPMKVQERYREASRLQVLSYVEQMMKGTPESRAFNQVKNQPAIQRYLSDVPMLQDAVATEQFLLSTARLTQFDINSLTKGELVKKLRADRAMTASTASRVFNEMQEDVLKDFMGRLQAAQSRAYASAVVDRLSDHLPLIDLRMLLTMEGKESLVMSVANLPNSLDVFKLKMPQLLTILSTHNTRGYFSGLDAEQAARLVDHLRRLVYTGYSIRLWDQVCQLEPTPLKQKLAHALRAPVCQRLVHCVSLLTTEDLRRIEDAPTLEEVLSVIGDAAVSEAIMPLKRGATRQMLSRYTIELGTLVNSLAKRTNDWRLGEMWEYIQDLWGSIGIHPGTQGIIKIICSEYIKPCVHELFERITHTVDKLDAAGRVISNYMDETEVCSEASEQFLKDCLEIPEAVSATASNGWSAGISLCPWLKTTCCAEASPLELISTSIGFYYFMELPYGAFVEIAQNIKEFDIRDIVIDSVDRYLLPYLMAFLYDDDRAQALFPNLADISMVSIATPSSMLASIASPASGISPARTAGRQKQTSPYPNRAEIMNLLVNTVHEHVVIGPVIKMEEEMSPTTTMSQASRVFLGEGSESDEEEDEEEVLYFDSVINCLRDMSEAQLHILLASFSSLFVNTKVGQLFLVMARSFRLPVHRGGDDAAGKEALGLATMAFGGSPMAHGPSAVHENALAKNTAHPAFPVLQAAYQLQTLIRTDPYTITSAFKGFLDADDFFDDSVTRWLLIQRVPDESLVRRILTFSKAQLQLLFFCIQHLELCRTMRAEAFAALASAQRQQMLQDASGRGELLGSKPPVYS